LQHLAIAGDEIMPNRQAAREPADGSGAHSQWRLAFPAGLFRDTLVRLEIPEAMVSPAAYRRFALLQFVYSTLGLIVGLVCVLGGIVLFFHGVAGATSWAAKILGAESQLSDAAPGAVLFLVGLFIVLITRFTIRIKK
jgi:hypothetical protein